MVLSTTPDIPENLRLDFMLQYRFPLMMVHWSDQTTEIERAP